VSEPHTLVEPFFRHESGRVSAVLTRSPGVRLLALGEDVVQVSRRFWMNRVPADRGSAPSGGSPSPINRDTTQ
jgi:hypothetical protein